MATKEMSMATRRVLEPEEEAERPRIAVVEEIDGEEVVVYYDSEEEFAASITDDDIADALSLAGVWSDIDWDDMEAALDAIRHSTPPTPPIEP
jgi:hypothetical protein